MNSDLLIVKAICKISSALDNLDELESVGEDTQYFSGKMKRDFYKFFDFFEHHTREMVTQMYAQDPSAWSDVVYYHLADIDTMVAETDVEFRNICLIVAKLQASLKDLKALEKSPSIRIFSEPLINRISPLITKSYMKKIPIRKEGMQKVCSEITKLVDEVIVE
jgi:hypothetical protein